MQTRTDVVDTIFRTLKWKIRDTITTTDSNTNRCNFVGRKVCLKETIKGTQSYQEHKWHINVLELLTLKLPLLKEKSVKSIYFKIGNKTALRYLLKMVAGSGT